MVASVPELANRHSGRPNRRASSSATTMASSVGWAKWVPRATRSRDRLDDRGVRVAGDRRAVAAVHVDVLVAVDVADLGALAVAHPDRLRLGDLPVGGGAAGQVFARPAMSSVLRG